MRRQIKSGLYGVLLTVLVLRLFYLALPADAGEGPKNEGQLEQLLIQVDELGTKTDLHKLEKAAAAVDNKKLKASLLEIKKALKVVQAQSEKVVEVLESLSGELADIALLGEIELSVRKAAVQGLYRLLLQLPGDQAELARQKIAQAVKEMRQENAKDPDLYLFSYYTVDPFSARSVQGAIGDIEQCLELDGSHAACQSYHTVLKEMAKEKRCSAKQVDPTLKLVLLNGEGVAQKSLMASTVLRGIKATEAGNNTFLMAFSSQGREKLAKFIADKQDSSSLALVLNYKSLPIPERKAVLAASILTAPYVEVTGLSFDEVCLQRSE